MRVVTAADTLRSVRDLYGAPVRCLSPIAPLYRPGEHVSPSRVTGRVERYTVPCGHCRVCVATRKSNWTGRLMAEASTSASVAFVTLTYRDAPETFRYSDVQQMMKRFRERLERERGTKVRFFCSGERGEKKGRVHWHILFFFDKPYEMRRTRKRQLWHFWPHGWANIQNLTAGENLLRKVRYTAKYCVKDAGKGDDTFMRCSLRPGIGTQYFVELAVRLAKAGLPAHGGFSMDGVRYLRGPKAGKAIEFRLTGNVARRFCEHYDVAWATFQGESPVPATRFRATFAENYVAPVSTGTNDYSTEQQTIHVAEIQKRPIEEVRKSGYFFFYRGRDVAMLCGDPITGAFLAFDPDGEVYTIREDIREVYNMDDADARVVNLWMRMNSDGPKPSDAWGTAFKKFVYNTFDAEQAERRKRAQAARAKGADREAEAARSRGYREAGGFTSATFGRAESEALAQAVRARNGIVTHDDEFAGIQRATAI